MLKVALSSGLSLFPPVFECYRAVEYKIAVAAVFIDTEVTQASELKFVAYFAPHRGADSAAVLALHSGARPRAGRLPRQRLRTQ